MRRDRKDPERALLGPDPIDIEVGARVRILRHSRKMTQSALAAKIGVTFQQVQKYERGANRISISTATRIARALDTTIPELVGEVADPNRSVEQALEVYGERGVSELVEAFARIQRAPLRRALIDLVRQVSEGVQ